MKARTNKAGEHRGFLPMMVAMNMFVLLASCASLPPVPQEELDAWSGASVEELDEHTFFKEVPMFRTKTESGTEIRNYAYGYNFGECIGEAGGDQVGGFVNHNDFISCSSSRVACNNIFYIKEQTVLEYAPTGRCDMNGKALTERPTPNPTIQ